MRRGGGKGAGEDKRLGPVNIGLWLSEASLSLTLAGVVILVAGLAIYLVVEELRTPAIILMFLGLLMLAVPLATNFTSVRKAATARAGRYTTNTLVMVAAFTTILILVGFISFENSYRLDVTATRQFTLAPQTKQILKELKEPVRAVGYFNPNDSAQELAKRRVDDFFHEFNRRNRDFSYEFVDPDLKPSQARRDGVTEYPTIVFKAPESERNPYRLTPNFSQQTFEVAEQDMVSSLLIITGTEQKAVYFTTGHGERDIQDAEEESNGYGFVRRGLIGDNYRLCTINLKQVGSVPTTSTGPLCGQAAAAVLVVAGPTRNILPDERAIIQEYLLDGGRALFLIDEPEAANLNKLLNLWGVNVAPGAIVDLGSSIAGDPRSPLVRRSQYNRDNPIVRPLDDTFFTEAAGIQDIIERSPEGLPPNPDELNITLTPLGISSVLSCITTDKDQTDCSGDEDILGPHAIALAVEALAPVGSDPAKPLSGEDVNPTSIVVFGDSDFASNKFYFAFSNGDFFLNAVDWLAQRYDLISIRAKPQAFRQLIITQKEFDFIRYSSWFLLPAGILLLAGVAWWRQR
ncbi:MAG: GldG family protein [Chloroflexi bacterium]|nr:GldG family protein [Chloroflexota bacterium]